jgi:hypothetical protein
MRAAAHGVAEATASTILDLRRDASEVAARARLSQEVVRYRLLKMLGKGGLRRGRRTHAVLT